MKNRIHQIANAGLTLSLKSLLRIYPAPEPRVFRGSGSVVELARHIANRDPQSVLLITANTFVRNRMIDPIVEVFQSAGIHVEMFTGIPPNPSLDIVEKGTARCLEQGCGAIYAIGGGSVIDAAKGIAAQVGNHVPAKKLIGLFKVWKKALPLYVVPSTSGSGSEVTNAAVLSDPETHQKGFLFDHKIVPLAVALDPEVTRCLPPGLTAATGMDAMTHAVESYISKVRDARSERLAVSAIRAIFEHLPQAYQSGDDRNAREAMSVAAYEAGVAFTRSGLGFVHAISHQLTAFYGIPHGIANAVLLPYVLQVSKPKATAALARLAEATGLPADGRNDEALADAFIQKIRSLSATLELPTAFPEIQETDMATIARNAIREATFNFPVPMMLRPEDCQTILRNLKEGRFQLGLDVQSVAGAIVKSPLLVS